MYVQSTMYVCCVSKYVSHQVRYVILNILLPTEVNVDLHVLPVFYFSCIHPFKNIKKFGLKNLFFFGCHYLSNVISVHTYVNVTVALRGIWESSHGG